MTGRFGLLHIVDLGRTFDCTISVAIEDRYEGPSGPRMRVRLLEDVNIPGAWARFYREGHTRDLPADCIQVLR